MSLSWTPTRIRRALLLPKPQKAIARAYDHHYGRVRGGPPRTPAVERMLNWFAEHADLLEGAPPPPDAAMDYTSGAGAWLVVPAPAWLLEALACLGADTSDLEPDADNEADSDSEPEESDNDEIVEADHLKVTPAQRERYRNSTRGHAREAARGLLKVFAAERK